MGDFNSFKDNILLITGGTGSFGQAVLQQFIDSDLKEIRIFSRDEKKQDDLRKKMNNPKVKFYIGDVRDPQSIDSVMNGVDYVFHAAALKQVPTAEFFPWEAIKTNSIGALNVINSAIKYQVKKVIVLSTDKAVYPINAMGMSKALMEKIMIAKSREANHKTILCGTRYGNVMGSRGSVIPLFIEQIKSGKPITITNPHMTRFMMSLEDAVNLVLFAYENAEPGDVFVQKAPAATIGDLAQALLELFQAKNPIKIIGTRHGEKLYESLVTREEMAHAIDLGDYYRIPADTRDLNYEIYFSKGDHKIDQIEEYNSQNTIRLDIEGIKKLLLKLKFVRKELNLD
ncbi:MAG: polysaccharide biosynthesis protein [Candidatus Helarchaeota archaeon]